MYQLIDGKKIAGGIIAGITQQIIDGKIEPQLAVILVGDDPASHLYVRLKEEACKKAGIGLHKYFIEDNAPEQQILDTINFLNSDPEIDAILIQLPLPSRYNQQRILDEMDFRKDVDGFHKKNIESYVAGEKQHILPGLSLAIWNLIATTGTENYKGKNVLIIAKEGPFRDATAKLLTDQGMLVSVASPSDTQLKQKTTGADILVTVVGKARFVTSDMVKNGATIIDVGINKTDGKTVGDVDFEHVAPQCAYITPVPGGVGPMTIAMLITNTFLIARERAMRNVLKK